MVCYSHSIDEIKEALVFPSVRDILNLSSLSEYMELGVPSALMLCLEWWVFEIMILMAGFIGVDEQASQFLVIQITDLLLMVAFGFQ